MTSLRATRWDRPLSVRVIPVAGNSKNEAVNNYIQTLDQHYFSDLVRFFKVESKHHTLPFLTPYTFTWGAPITQRPPLYDSTSTLLGNFIYSLRLRAYHLKNRLLNRYSEDIIVYAVFYPVEQRPEKKFTSTAVAKAMICIDHLFIEEKYSAHNNLVLAHELLHLSGATDKYRLSDRQPIYPSGYAQPNKQPLHPQTSALLMAGVIALSPTLITYPKTMNQVTISDITAEEIGWITP